MIFRQWCPLRLALAAAAAAAIAAIAAILPAGTASAQRAEGGYVSIAGSTVSGPLILNGTGGWSNNNFGRQLLVTTPAGFSNPAIGITDAAGTGYWGIEASSNTLNFYEMPPFTNSSSSPTLIGSISNGTSGSIGGISFPMTLTAAPPVAFQGILNSNINLNFNAAATTDIYTVLSVLSDNGASGNGTFVTTSAGEFDAFVNATDDNSGTASAAFDFGTHPTCIKHNPGGGLPTGKSLKNCETQWSLMLGENNKFSSMSGNEVIAENDYSVNGLDDVGNRPAHELIFGTNTSLSSGGWPASITLGYLIAAEGTDASNGAVYIGDYMQFGINFNNSVLNLQKVGMTEPKITSTTPGSPVYSVTVDNIMPLSIGNISFRTIGVGGSGAADTAAQTKTTTASVSNSTTIPLSSVYYLQVGMFIYDITTPSDIPVGTYISSIGTSTVTATVAVNAGNGDTLIFAGGMKAVTINGDAYTVAGVTSTAAGSTAGTVYFTSAVSVADATNGVSILPNAHAIWLCPGSSTAPWCDIAFNATGSANMRGDGSGGILLNAKQITTTGGIILPQSTVAALPACNAAAQGELRGVTDASAPAYNASLTGGGAVKVMAYCNGTSWTAH